MCEPRLNSQRIEGRERDAGCDFSSGTSKRLRVAMPPEARREVVMLNVWIRAVVEGIFEEI